jgi:uncharacterized protein (TIGR00290 family)
MSSIDKTARKVFISWSGGKDSCLALYEIQQSHEYQIAALLTTITKDYDRVSVHGVRRELLEIQAAQLRIPLRPVLISKGATNEEYEARFLEACFENRGGPVDTVVFGDLFLEDIKKYRDEFLARNDLRGMYPVWLRDTSKLIMEFLALGFKAIVTCTDEKVLGPEFVGRTIDSEFLSELPATVDPCGENGEFHTFVFDGPNFAQRVQFSKGEIVQREGFWFCDLLAG